LKSETTISWEEVGVERVSSTIVIPTYNEEESIGSVLDHIQEVMASSSVSYQVLVVDDGSTDRTVEIVKSRGVEIVRHPTNRGYGAALKMGIRHARHEVIVITDADGTYPNEEIPHLIELMADYDMVVGARTGEEVHIPLLRRPAKWFTNTLANYFARTRIPDLNSGLRAFRKELALRFYPILPDGFSFTTTITLAMLTNGYLVGYVPINYHQRVGRSKIRPVYDTLNLTLLIVRTTIYYAPLRVFLPLSGFLFLMGVVVGLYSYFILGRLMDVTTVVLVLAALQTAAAGLLADMIDKRTPRF
jgi:glycosyltransferase involved in cell wall biosynthesis